MMSKYCSKNIAYIAALIIIATVYVLFFKYTPPVLDDLMFEAEYLNANDGSNTFSADAWWQYIQQVRANDNSRISNMMAPFSTIISPWNIIFPYLSGVIFALLVAMTVYIIGLHRYRYAGIAAIWLIFTIFLPWRNSMLVADYTLNYIYAAFVNLAFLILLLRGDRHGRWHTLKMLLMLPLAVIAGGWHEGFTFPILSGLALYIFFNRGRVTPVQWVLIILYAVTGVVFALSPGMIARAAHEAGDTNIHTNYIKFVIDLIITLTAMAAIAAPALFPRYRSTLSQLLHEPYFVIFGAAMISSTLLSVIFTHTPRTAFFPTVCGVIVLGIICRPAICKLFDRHNYLPWLTYGFCCAVCLIHAVHSLHWIRIIYTEYCDITAGFKAGATTVFYDITMPEQVPATTLYFPARIHWVTAYHLNNISELLRSDECSVVPESLRYADELNSESLGGTANAYRKDGALWFHRPADADCFFEMYFNITFTDGRQQKHAPAFVRSFTTDHNQKADYIKLYKVDARDVAEISIDTYTSYTSNSGNLEK